MYKKNFILFIHVARILASIISLAGGYVFIYKYVFDTVSNAIVSHVITSIVLVFIEAVSISMLTVGFTNVYERQWKLYTVFLLIAFMFLSISFVVTTNGAEEWVNIKKDKTVEIAVDYSIAIENNEVKYTGLIDKYRLSHDSIRTLKIHPYLSVRQQRTEEMKHLSSLISYYTDRLNKEKEIYLNNKKKDITANIKDTENTKFIYFILASIVILGVFIFNFLLVFMKYNKPETKTENISSEINKFQNVSSEIKNFKSEISDESEIFSEINEIINISLDDKIKIIIDSNDDIETKVKKLKTAGIKQYKIAELLNLSKSKVTRILKKII